MKYVTKKDIVVSAGTVLHETPPHTEYHSEHGEAVIALGKDVTMTLIIPIETGDPAFDELVTSLK